MGGGSVRVCVRCGVVVHARGPEADPKLKDEVDGDLFVHGSGELALLARGLIDEYESERAWGRGCQCSATGGVAMEIEDVSGSTPGWSLTYLRRK